MWFQNDAMMCAIAPKKYDRTYICMCVVFFSVLYKDMYLFFSPSAASDLTIYSSDWSSVYWSSNDDDSVVDSDESSTITECSSISRWSSRSYHEYWDSFDVFSRWESSSKTRQTEDGPKNGLVSFLVHQHCCRPCCFRELSVSSVDIRS